jgi:hypothetical protein
MSGILTILRYIVSCLDLLTLRTFSTSAENRRLGRQLIDHAMTIEDPAERERYLWSILE